MALFYKKEYRKYIIDHIDILNKRLKENYDFTIYIHLSDKWEILLTKTWTDGVLYTYDELETSITFIDYYTKKFSNVFLFTEKRQNYLLDIIKRIWEMDKAENLLSETIRKGYIQ